MTANKSSVALQRGIRHFQRARLWLSRPETLDALQEARAAFSAAGRPRAAAWCESLRRDVQAAGIDELPALPASLLEEDPDLPD